MCTHQYSSINDNHIHDLDNINELSWCHLEIVQEMAVVVLYVGGGHGSLYAITYLFHLDQIFLRNPTKTPQAILGTSKYGITICTW